MKVLEFEKNGFCQSLNFGGSVNFVVNIISQQEKYVWKRYLKVLKNSLNFFPNCGHSI